MIFLNKFHFIEVVEYVQLSTNKQGGINMDGFKDNVSGTKDKIKGEVKEAYGEMTNNKKKKADGKVTKVKGKVKKAIGKVKNQTNEKADEWTNQSLKSLLKKGRDFLEWKQVACHIICVWITVWCVLKNWLKKVHNVVWNIL